MANLDRILEIGRNGDGLHYNEVGGATGEILDRGIADTWRYVLNGYHALYLSDAVERYRDAVGKALAALPEYRDYSWEGADSADGMADAFESALTLPRWEPDGRAFAWCAHAYNKMLSLQRPDGIIEGRHGDGNLIRSALMWAFYLSQDTYVESSRQDVAVGAVPMRAGPHQPRATSGWEDSLLVYVQVDRHWRGGIRFDRPRRRDYLSMDWNHPRINSFAEWFAARPAQKYSLLIGDSGQRKAVSGDDLIRGVAIEVRLGTPIYLIVTSDSRSRSTVSAFASTRMMVCTRER